MLGMAEGEADRGDSISEPNRIAQYRAVLFGDQDEARRVLGHNIADVRLYLRGR